MRPNEGMGELERLYGERNKEGKQVWVLHLLYDGKTKEDDSLLRYITSGQATLSECTMRSPSLTFPFPLVMLTLLIQV